MEVHIVTSYCAPDSARGFPKVFEFGLCGSVQCLVMEMLGPNLGDLLKVCGGRFSLQTCLVIAIQILDRIETLHTLGYIYRYLVILYPCF